MAQKNSLRKEPKQDRSRKTAENILKAVMDFMDEGRDFDSLTLSEIAGRAGTTTGGFYARFTSKQAVLIALFQDVVAEEYRAAILEAMDPEACAGKDLRFIVSSYIATMAEAYRKHPAIWRHISLSIKVDETFSAAGDLTIQLNRDTYGALRTRVLERKEAIGHPDPDFALDLASFFVDSVLHYKICVGLTKSIPFSHVNWESDERLIEELTNAFLAYLEVKEPQPDARPELAGPLDANPSAS